MKSQLKSVIYCDIGRTVKIAIGNYCFIWKITIGNCGLAKGTISLIIFEIGLNLELFYKKGWLWSIVPFALSYKQVTLTFSSSTLLKCLFHCVLYDKGLEDYLVQFSARNISLHIYTWEFSCKLKLLFDFLGVDRAGDGEQGVLWGIQVRSRATSLGGGDNVEDSRDALRDSSQIRWWWRLIYSPSTGPMILQHMDKRSLLVLIS